MGEVFTAQGVSVLIVDDSKINLKVAQSLLKPLQMDIDTADSGLSAISKVQEKEYDIIFMDYLMPGMDGVEATRQIRELPVDFVKEVPIIALTGNDEEGMREQLMEQGLNDFLTKPIDLQEICDIIKRWLPQDSSDGKTDGKEEDKDDGIPDVEGLDVEYGIAQSGGLDVYKEILGVFGVMIPQKVQKIEKCLADSLLRDYTIEVHALKTNARLIGALELSEMCRKLEDAGNREDEEILVRDTPEMLRLYRSYQEVLRPYCEKNEAEKKETTKEHLVSILRQLHSAMDVFDLDGVDTCMQELEEYRMPSVCQEFMENMRVYVADVAMEDIMKTAEQMIDVLN